MIRIFILISAMEDLVDSDAQSQHSICKQSKNDEQKDENQLLNDVSPSASNVNGAHIIIDSAVTSVEVVESIDLTTAEELRQPSPCNNDLSAIFPLLSLNAPETPTLIRIKNAADDMRNVGRDQSKYLT